MALILCGFASALYLDLYASILCRLRTVLSTVRLSLIRPQDGNLTERRLPTPVRRRTLPKNPPCFVRISWLDIDLCAVLLRKYFKVRRGIPFCHGTVSSWSPPNFRSPAS